MPTHDLLEPFPLFGYGPVKPTPQLLLDDPVLCPHTVAAGLPLKLEAPAARCATDEREPEEHEGLRFSEPLFLRLTAARRPNSITRVLSRWSDSMNSSSLARIAS